MQMVIINYFYSPLKLYKSGKTWGYFNTPPKIQMDANDDLEYVSPASDNGYVGGIYSC